MYPRTRTTPPPTNRPRHANHPYTSSFYISDESIKTPTPQKKATRRASMPSTGYVPVDQEGPSPPSPAISHQRAPRPPPSSFQFPFQAHAGNPDPGTHIPGVRRRSFDVSSLSQDSTHSDNDLRKPFAPFMAERGASGSGTTTPNGDASSTHGSIPRTSSSNSLYKQSAAANITTPTAVSEIASPIPRNSSVHSFRAPFLSPSSRPTSSLWSPPNYTQQFTNIPLIPPQSPNASTTALPLGHGSSPYATQLSKSKPPLPSTRLPAPLTKHEKPWLQRPQRGERFSYFLTLFFLFLGLAGAAILCWRGVSDVLLLDESQLCMVMDDSFDGSSLNTDNWSLDVELGGFGNGEFEMTTDAADNLFLQNSQLYIVPTLTSQVLPDVNIFNGANYTLPGCTSKNASACRAVSNAQTGRVINPVRSARINTQGKKSIKFGKVEIRAKLPRGDWLWPAIWMMPVDSTYGAWPASGEIDLVEARGNDASYKAQGNNFIRASLNYGPIAAGPVLNQIFGWFGLKRTNYAAAFHTYTMEWTEEWIRIYVDSRLKTMLDLKLKKKGKGSSMWGIGNFPQTARNHSDSLVVVQDPWEGRGGIAPFDQEFYLIMNLAAGGTSGWFPDNVGGKPWFDGSLSAMHDFAKAQDTWSATWPQSVEDRSMRVDYVKMWTKC
ncbi:concanavalin A-like lectin/glucanase domain-containing protein [Panaeolus papilionaceus]|nr:concanavalin A-like lectin/glucanase domain-containing protein [Panaeolus papilionaceus]